MIIEIIGIFIQVLILISMIKYTKYTIDLTKETEKQRYTLENQYRNQIQKDEPLIREYIRKYRK